MSDRSEAVVQVGTEVTCYLRCGHGPVVVAVTTSAVEREHMIARLCADHRVIAPVPPAFDATSPGGALIEPADMLAGWLRGVIDGLGLVRPQILLSGRLAGLMGLGPAEED